MTSQWAVDDISIFLFYPKRLNADALFPNRRGQHKSNNAHTSNAENEFKQHWWLGNGLTWQNPKTAAGHADQAKQAEA